MAKQRVPRTRNGNSMTEAQFWGMLRSTLRKRWMFWKPRKYALDATRREYKGANKRRKWEYQCNECKEWFDRKSVEVDHKNEAGSLKSYDDLPGFVERLFCEEPECYDVLCKKCHRSKTNNQKRKK